MQETNLYTITIPPVVKSLESLSKLLDKAAEHAAERKTTRFDFEESLLQSRLVFDQFPLVRQIQIAADNAKSVASRLAEIELPKYEDTEKSIEELKARLDKTIAFVKSIKPEQIIGKEGVKVSLPHWEGKYMTGFEYVTEQLLPNFYFHMTTAYAILRKNGVHIGKGDFLGPLPLK